MSKQTFKFTKEELLEFLDVIDKSEKYRVHHDKLERWDGDYGGWVFVVGLKRL